MFKGFTNLHLQRRGLQPADTPSDHCVHVGDREITVFISLIKHTYDEEIEPSSSHFTHYCLETEAQPHCAMKELNASILVILQNKRANQRVSGFRWFHKHRGKNVHSREL